MSDPVLKFITKVDLSGIESGMSQTVSTVKSAAQSMAQAMQTAQVATQNLASAQAELGRAAIDGNAQAATIIGQYAEAARQAEAAVQELASAQQSQSAAAIENASANEAAAPATARVGVSARQSATAGIGILEGRMQSGNRAAGAFLATTLGLGPVLEAAFPIVGVIALGEVLVDVAGKIANIYDEFVNLRALQNETFKEMIADEGTEIQLSNEQLRLLRERSVLAAQTVGGKTGRSARGEEAGANFDLSQAKNDLAIVNAQIAEFQSRVNDLQARANAKPTFSLATKDSQSNDQKVASIELPEAVQRLNNALAEQKNLQTQIGDAQLQGDLRHQQAAEAGAAAAKEAYSRQLAEEKQSEELIDRGAKKEEERYKKLQEIQNTANEHARSLKPDDIDASTGAVRTAEDDFIGGGDARVKAFEIQQQNSDAIAEASIRAQAATGSITSLGAAQALAAQHTKEYNEELAQLLSDLQVYESMGKDVEAAQTRNQISQVQGRMKVTGIEDQASIVQQSTQPWIDGANKIAGAWTGAFDNILRGGRSSWDAVGKAGEQTVLGLINGAERLTLNWIEMSLKRVVTHQASTQAIVATDAAGAAQTKAISETTAITQIGHEAAVVFAKVYSALADIPIVGPVLAPVAAAGAYAGVVAMAAFDQGTSAVPRTGMAIIHEGEAILPPPQASMMREWMRGGGGEGQSRSGLRDLHFTYHSGQPASSSDARKSMRELHSQLRRQGLVQ